jgi:hypothetical protein
MIDSLCTICGNEAKHHPVAKTQLGVSCTATEVDVLHDVIIGLEEDCSELQNLVGRYMDPSHVSRTSPNWLRDSSLIQRCIFKVYTQGMMLS